MRAVRKVLRVGGSENRGGCEQANGEQANGDIHTAIRHSLSQEVAGSLFFQRQFQMDTSSVAHKS